MAHHIEQPGRSLGVEQLRLHGDAARVGPGELVDGGHAARLGGACDIRPLGAGPDFYAEEQVADPETDA